MSLRLKIEISMGWFFFYLISLIRKHQCKFRWSLKREKQTILSPYDLYSDVKLAINVSGDDGARDAVISAL